MAQREVRIDLSRCLWMECFSPPWRETDQVALATMGPPAEVAAVVERLLASSPGVVFHLLADTPHAHPLLAGDGVASELHVDSLVLVTGGAAGAAFRDGVAELCLTVSAGAVYLVDEYHYLIDITRHTTPRTVGGRVYRGFAWVEPGTWRRLYHLARVRSRSGTVVEIGSFVGGSTLALAAACRDEDDGGAITVDTVLADGFYQTIEHAGLGKHVVAIEGRSDAVAESWPVRCSEHGIDPSVGLLFVDGDHSYLGVLTDLRAWAPHLAQDAVVVVHDYFNPFQPGVARAVHEYLAGSADWRICETLEDAVVCSRQP